MTRYRVAVIGASLGGTAVLKELMKGMKKGFEIPVVVVLHRSETFGDNENMIDLFKEYTPLSVKEAYDKEPIQKKCMYFAPSGYHLMVSGDCFHLSTEEKVSSARPSIDVLFESAARSWGTAVLAITLTSSSEDGVSGAGLIMKNGGKVLVQERLECRCGFLSESVLKNVSGAKEMKLRAIVDYLNKQVYFSEQGGGEDA